MMIRGNCFAGAVLFWICFSTSINTSVSCDLDEGFQFVYSALDVGVMIAGGCTSMLTARISEECCDTVAEISSDPCADYVVAFSDDSWPSMLLIYHVLDLCRVEIGIGYTMSGCPDGIVTGEEQCDDGNSISGDGCSSYCFVEAGYDCFPDNNGTSICWQCEEECFLQNREVCIAPGGPCGDCLDGYGTNDLGYCATRKHVYYASITEYSGNETSCVYHDVGYALQGTPVRSSEPFLSLIRNWKPDRSDLAGNANCSLSTAMNQAVFDDDVILVLELFVPEAKAAKLTIGKDAHAHIVIFSDQVSYATLVSRQRRIFDVFPNASLYLHHVSATNCAASEGAVVRNFGTVVLEDVVVFDCREDPLTDTLLVQYECAGILASSYGYFRLQDVVFTDSVVQMINNSAMCLHYENSGLVLVNDVYLSNVTFSDIYIDGALVQLELLSNSSSVENLIIERVTSHGVLVDGRSSLIIDGLYIRHCIGSDWLVALTQTSHVLNFETIHNTLLADAGIFVSIGASVLSDGTTSHNTNDKFLGAAVTNQGYLEMYNITIEENGMGAVKSTSQAFIRNCTFRNNYSSLGFTSINNAGFLTVDTSEFVWTRGDTDAVTIKSTAEVVIRDCILPDPEKIPMFDCGSVVYGKDGRSSSLCGIKAICTESDYAGIHCECPSDYIGDSLTLCSQPMKLEILPENRLVLYLQKAYPFVFSSFRGLIPSGLGTLDWAVDYSTLPPWLSVSQMGGTFVNVDACPSDWVREIMSVNTLGVVSSRTSAVANVVIWTNSSYNGVVISENIPVEVTVDLRVEVPANATYSVVSPAKKDCLNGVVCSVKAGSTVSLFILLRDNGGLVQDVGGTRVDVKVYQAATWHGELWSPFESTDDAFDDGDVSAPLGSNIVADKNGAEGGYRSKIPEEESAAHRGDQGLRNVGDLKRVAPSSSSSTSFSSSSTTTSLSSPHSSSLSAATAKEAAASFSSFRPSSSLSSSLSSSAPSSSSSPSSSSTLSPATSTSEFIVSSRTARHTQTNLRSLKGATTQAPDSGDSGDDGDPDSYQYSSVTLVSLVDFSNGSYLATFEAPFFSVCCGG
eukprot:Rmarinus@m.18715